MKRWTPNGYELVIIDPFYNYYHNRQVGNSDVFNIIYNKIESLGGKKDFMRGGETIGAYNVRMRNYIKKLENLQDNR